MSVSVDYSSGDSLGQNLQTTNPQQVSSVGLQTTGGLQNVGGRQQAVLGASTINDMYPVNALSVPGTSELSGPTETTPVQSSSFNVPPLAIYAVVGLLILGAISFVWSQASSSH